ncbi:MAG: CHAP domain-containing protein [Candidatus Dormiibacterota bacterium]
MRVHRYLTHAIVLGIAVAMSSYASVDKHFPTYLTARLGAVNAEAVVVSQGGSVGDVSLGRYSTIIKPLSIPTAALISHTPMVYTVAAGESLADIAARYHVTVSQIRWSNPTLLTYSDVAPNGSPLLIPPIPGVVVTARAGDTVDSLAAAYKADAGAIADYNRFREMQLVAGTLVVIPGGVGPNFPPPLLAAPSFYAFFHSTIGAPVGTYNAVGFPWGWCTWYVATRRPVPWRGNAIEWYGNARAMGFPVGSKPQAGAIMVTTESPIGLGHVAYVEQVNGDGSWLVSEMHYVAFGVTSQRVIRPGQLGGALIGFIYGFTPPS